MTKAETSEGMGARRIELGLHDTLWAANAEIANACLAHPFVRGLANGSLPIEAFRRYVAQDAFFLRAFARAYALAAAKCEETEHVAAFHRLLGGALDELKLHRSYATELDIDVERVTPYAATSAYTNFLLRVAWHEGVPQTLAALAPCMRLYAFLGRALADFATEGNPYRDWIATYAAPEFQALAAELERLLDELGVDTPGVRDTYRYAMNCELDFFSAPLEEPREKAGQ